MPVRSTLLAVALTVWASAACSSRSALGETCTVNSDCDPALCVDGVCRNACTDDVECDAGESCAGGVCRLAGDRSPGGDTRASGDTATGDSNRGDAAMGDTEQGDTLLGDTLLGDTAMGDQAPPACTPMSCTSDNCTTRMCNGPTCEETPTGNCHRLIAFLDPADTVPAGWTCISDDSFDPFFERFVRAAPSFGAVGDISDHTHASPLSVTVGNAVLTGHAFNCGGCGAMEIQHTHGAQTGTVSTEDHLPPYRNVLVIQSDDPVDTLPTGVIALFDAAMFPTFHWSAYTDQDGAFIRGGATAETGGSATHSHTVSGTTPNKTTSGDGDPLDMTLVGISNHFHNFNIATTAGNNEPAHVSLVLGEVTHPMGAPLAAGIIALFDADPGAGWTVLSALNGVFIKGASSPSTTPASADSHTHPAGTSPSGTGGGVQVGASPGYVRSWNAPYSVAAAGHSHSANHAQTSSTAHLPPYINVIIAKKD